LSAAGLDVSNTAILKLFSLSDPFCLLITGVRELFLCLSTLSGTYRLSRYLCAWD